MSQRGSTLIEAIAALTLVGITVLMASSSLGSVPHLAARLDARHDLVRALDATLEGVRGGLLPLEDRILHRAPIPTRRPVTVRIEVEPDDVPGLWRLTVTASCQVFDAAVQSRVTTKIWRQP